MNDNQVGYTLIQNHTKLNVLLTCGAEKPECRYSGGWYHSFRLDTVFTVLP